MGRSVLICSLSILSFRRSAPTFELIQFWSWAVVAVAVSPPALIARGSSVMSLAWTASASASESGKRGGMVLFSTVRLMAASGPALSMPSALRPVRMSAGSMPWPSTPGTTWYWPSTSSMPGSTGGVRSWPWRVTRASSTRTGLARNTTGATSPSRKDCHHATGRATIEPARPMSITAATVASWSTLAPSSPTVASMVRSPTSTVTSVSWYSSARPATVSVSSASDIVPTSTPARVTLRTTRVSSLVSTAQAATAAPSRTTGTTMARVNTIRRPRRRPRGRRGSGRSSGSKTLIGGRGVGEGARAACATRWVHTR